MALYLPIRVQDQGEGQSEEDRIAKLKEYIQEEHQPHKVELSGEGEVALVRERGETFFYSLLYNCGVTCAFYENDQPRVLIYGQKVSKRMAEHALRMWLSDPEQDIWKRSAELLVDGKFAAYCLSIVPPPSLHAMKRVTERHHVPGPRVLTREVCKAIQRASTAIIELTHNGSSVSSVNIEGVQPQVDLAKVMFEHWRRGGDVAIVCSPWLEDRPVSDTPDTSPSPSVSDSEEHGNDAQDEVDMEVCNGRGNGKCNGSMGATSSSASSMSGSSPQYDDATGDLCQDDPTDSADQPMDISDDTQIPPTLNTPIQRVEPSSEHYHEHTSIRSMEPSVQKTVEPRQEKGCNAGPPIMQAQGSHPRSSSASSFSSSSSLPLPPLAASAALAPFMPRTFTFRRGDPMGPLTDYFDPRPSLHTEAPPSHPRKAGEGARKRGRTVGQHETTGGSGPRSAEEGSGKKGREQKGDKGHEGSGKEHGTQKRSEVASQRSRAKTSAKDEAQARRREAVARGRATQPQPTQITTPVQEQGTAAPQDRLEKSEEKDTEGDGVAKAGGGGEGVELVDGKKDGLKKGGSGKKKEGGKGVRPNGQGEQPRRLHRKKTAPVKPTVEEQGEESGKAGAKRKRKPEGDAVEGGEGEEPGQGQGNQAEGAEAGSVKPPPPSRRRRKRRKQSDASDIEDEDYEIEDDEERLAMLEARRAKHRAGQEERMQQYDVPAMFATIRQQFMERFENEEYTEEDFVLIDELGCPNGYFDLLASTLGDAPQTLMLHGTKAQYASRILRRGFDPKKIRSGGDEGSKEAVFYFATDPGVADRWRKGDEVVDGELWAHCVVCVMLWARGSNIKLSGCTGGTIKVPARANTLLQPVFRFKYRSPMEQLQTFQNEHLKGKNKLEDPGLLPPKIWKEVSAVSRTKHPHKVLPMHIDAFLLPHTSKPSIDSLAFDFR